MTNDDSPWEPPADRDATAWHTHSREPEDWAAADRAALRLAAKQPAMRGAASGNATKNMAAKGMAAKGMAAVGIPAAGIPAPGGTPPIAPGDVPPYGDTPAHRLRGTPLAFVPVVLARTRSDGWSADVQERFILALEAMGSVGAAARSVGLGRASAYRCRGRPGAASFAEAWDIAVDSGRMAQYSAAMERAEGGVTTVRVLRGGHVLVRGGPDMALVRGAMTPPPATKATKETIW